MRLDLPKGHLRLVAEGKKSQICVPANRKVDNLRPGSSHVVGKELRVILLKAPRFGHADAITFDEARAEGWRTRDEFLEDWRERFGEARECWVLEVAVDRAHRPRLLHRDSSHGYTQNAHQALGQEPEAVDKSVQERFSADADEKGKALRAERHAENERRYAEAKARALAIGADITKQEMQVERAVQVMERKAAQLERGQPA